MIAQKLQNQGVLFQTPFDQELDSENHWIKFSQLLPWDKLSSFYLIRMDPKMVAVIKDARIVLGALIIKNHEGLSDEGTIEAIKENIYMQSFLGLPSFKRDAVFAPSLFVEIRKRLGLDYWQEINEIIIKENQPSINSLPKEENSKNDDPSSSNDPATNNGTINIDATIVEQDIQYPTDLNLLNESREKLEEFIDLICLKTNQKMPRTYRIKARKLYLNTAKKRRKTKKNT